MKISSVFFLSLLFIFPLHFIIESDENTDNITEKNITGRNIEEEVIRILKGYVYIYYMYFPEGAHQK